MQVINTNISSLNAQHNLDASQASLQTSLNRLSTGLRINSASDDAAGLAISQRFTSQINGMNQAARNANDGVSLAQTAEGDLGQIENNLQTLRTLAVQSANATNSASDRAALNVQAQSILSEVDRVASNSSFNGVKLLDGSFNGETFQVGANATSNDQITVSSFASARTSALGTYQGYSANNVKMTTSGTLSVGVVNADGTTTTTALTGLSTDAKSATAQINSAGIAGLTATANANNVTGGQTGATAAAGVTAGNMTLGLNGYNITIAVTGNQSTDESNAMAAINAKSAATGVTATDTGSGLKLQNTDGSNIVTTLTDTGTTGATAGNLGLSSAATVGSTTTTQSTFNLSYNASANQKSITFTATSGAVSGLTSGATNTLSTQGSALSTVDLSTVAGSTAALSTIDNALNGINSSRAMMGALQNRFTSVVSSLNTTSTNLTSSRSRIQDADFASETANLTKNQILQQAGTAMLAQANSLPNNVLTLLKG